MFNIYNLVGQYRETVVTSDGSGIGANNQLPTGVGVSSFNLQQGLYRIVEVQAPTGYFQPPDFFADPNNRLFELNPANPFSYRQLQPVFAGQYTNSLFANKPLPGRFNFGKVDTQATVLTGNFVPLAGAVFRIDQCTDSSCTAFTGLTIDTRPTDETGTFFFGLDEGYFAVGYYLITEIVTPPGFLASPPQIQQITPARIVDVLFSDKHMPGVTTQISDQTAEVGDVITDTINITGTRYTKGVAQNPPGQYATNVGIVLTGPLAPLTDANGQPTCVGVDFPVVTTGDPLLAQFDVATEPVTGDGAYTSLPFTVVTPGCYTYTETVFETDLVGASVPTPPGLVSETVLVTGTTPTPPR